MSTSLPTPSIPHDPHQNAPNSSRISIALVAAALFTFALFVFFSVHRRPSRDPSAIPPSSMMNKPSSMCKPKLWEVCLDEDHDGAVRDWQPINAWANNGLGWPPRSRQTSDAPQRALPEPVMNHHIAMAQVWFNSRCPAHLPPPRPPAPPPITGRRTLNVGVLVVMPSRQVAAQPTHGTTPPYPIGSRLSYAEGQLSIGTTSLSCDGPAQSPAPVEHEREQTA